MVKRELTSFTRSFIGVISSMASERRCLLALEGARKRWPNGRVYVNSKGEITYWAGGGLVGLMIVPKQKMKQPRAAVDTARFRNRLRTV